jgi:hypothetical protein
MPPTLSNDGREREHMHCRRVKLFVWPVSPARRAAQLPTCAGGNQLPASEPDGSGSVPDPSDAIRELPEGMPATTGARRKTLTTPQGWMLLESAGCQSNISAERF